MYPSASTNALKDRNERPVPSGSCDLSDHIFRVVRGVFVCSLIVSKCDRTRATCSGPAVSARLNVKRFHGPTPFLMIARSRCHHPSIDSFVLLTTSKFTNLRPFRCSRLTVRRIRRPSGGGANVRPASQCDVAIFDARARMRRGHYHLQGITRAVRDPAVPRAWL
jgi:hypothetical protein